MTSERFGLTHQYLKCYRRQYLVSLQTPNFSTLLPYPKEPAVITRNSFTNSYGLSGAARELSPLQALPKTRSNKKL